MYTCALHVTEHTLPAAYIREYPRATANGQEDVLHLAIKQYTPRESFDALHFVTVIAAHANGFPKELYEPLWDELYLRLKAKGVAIRGIWIADVAHQGASGVLNEQSLGNDPSWMDHPRDLFLMVNHFRHLMKRPLIALGHSMGGNNLINLSLMHPRLFTSLILIDPVVQRFPSELANFGPAKLSTNRRDTWPSRTAAESSFKRSKFYQQWDPRVLDSWIKYGLRDTDSPSRNAISTSPQANRESNTPAVMLTTTKSQEVFTFLRPNFGPQDDLCLSTHPDVDHSSPAVTPFYRPEPTATHFKLPFVRPSVLYIFGDESYLSTPLLRAEKLANTGSGVGGSGGTKQGRVAEVLLKNVGHLIPMERVADTADAAVSWIVPELDRWREIEDHQDREWAKVPRDQKSAMGEEYKAMMNADWNEVAQKRSNKSKL